MFRSYCNNFSAFWSRFLDNLIIHTAGVDAYQGKFVDLDVNDLHLSVGHLTPLSFVLLVGLEVRAEPQELKGSIWIMAVIHLVQAWHTHTHSHLTAMVFAYSNRHRGRGLAYQQTHWNGSQCRRLDNCSQHTRSQWTLHFLQREAVFFRQGHGQRGQNDVADCPFWLLGKPRLFISC